MDNSTFLTGLEPVDVIRQGKTPKTIQSNNYIRVRQSFNQSDLKELSLDESMGGIEIEKIRQPVFTPI